MGLNKGTGLVHHNRGPVYIYIHIFVDSMMKSFLVTFSPSFVLGMGSNFTSAIENLCAQLSPQQQLELVKSLSLLHPPHVVKRELGSPDTPYGGGSRKQRQNESREVLKAFMKDLPV